jgi:hypothetical protein
MNYTGVIYPHWGQRLWISLFGGPVSHRSDGFRGADSVRQRLACWLCDAELA